MMRSLLVAVLASGVVMLIVSSCATVPIEPLASGELRLLSMRVPMKEDIRASFPFVVNISFEADGKPEIRTACFYFSGDGPYCSKITDVNYGSPGTIRIQLRANNPGPSVLESYVLYIRDGKIQPTNVVDTHFRVIGQ